MGLLIKWDITYKCNLMCGHCINGDYLNNKVQEISTSEVKSIIDKIHKNIKIEYIHFLGGEPLTRTDFVEILHYLNDNKIRFGFNSNGILVNKNLIENLGKLEFFDNIVLSLEGPNAQINDEIRGRNVFYLLLNRIKMLNDYKKQNRNVGFKVCINTVVTSQNYNYILDIIRLCQEQDVDELSLLEFIEEGNGIGKNLSLNEEQFMQVVKTVAEEYTHNNGKLKIIPKFVRPLAKDYVKNCLNLDFPTAIHGCGAGASSLFLDNMGKIYPCDRERKFKGREYELLKEEFWTIWNSDTFSKPFKAYFGDKKYRNLTPCNECKYLYDECFPCHLYIKENERAQMNQCVLFDMKIKERQRVVKDAIQSGR